MPTTGTTSTVFEGVLIRVDGGEDSNGGTGICGGMPLGGNEALTGRSGMEVG